MIFIEIVKFLSTPRFITCLTEISTQLAKMKDKSKRLIEVRGERAMDMALELPLRYAI